MHTHKGKQEDIICRIGTFAMRLAGRTTDWKVDRKSAPVRVLLNGQEKMVPGNSVIYLKAGERITLYPGAFHEFWPVSEYAILGEVSTHNDDLHDNFFENPDVGRFEEIEEDEPRMETLLSDRQ
jgi:D-lyxose ketol-isomerase